MDCFTRFEYFFALDSLAKGNGVISGSYMWESEIHRKLQRSYSQTLATVIETNTEIERDGAEWLPFKSEVFSGTWENFLDFKKDRDEKITERARDFIITKSH